jgi:hypothetical protein
MCEVEDVLTGELPAALEERMLDLGEPEARGGRGGRRCGLGSPPRWGHGGQGELREQEQGGGEEENGGTVAKQTMTK